MARLKPCPSQPLPNPFNPLRNPLPNTVLPRVFRATAGAKAPTKSSAIGTTEVVPFRPVQKQDLCAVGAVPGTLVHTCSRASPKVTLTSIFFFPR